MLHEIFWSLEAIYANSCSDDERRESALRILLKPRPLEMYFFLQAYLHSAPQILLQFHILLQSEVYYRDTGSLQLMSIAFSLLRMAITTMRYQRFERRKVVGICYPWSSKQLDRISKIYSQSEGSIMFEEESSIQQTDNQKNLLDDWLKIHTKMSSARDSNQQSDTIYENDSVESFEEPITTSTSAVPETSYSEAKNSVAEVFAINSVVVNNPMYVKKNSTINFGEIESDLDDEVFLKADTPITKTNYENMVVLDEITEDFDNRRKVLIVDNPDVEKRRSLRLTESRRKRVTDMSKHTTPPSTPAPRPASLIAIRNKIISNAESIVERIPRRRYKDDDTMDLPVRVRKNAIKGIEDEDGVAKVVAFFAWLFFITSRMLALASFSSFYLNECFFICLSHYILMVAMIMWNSRRENLNRKVFYLFLGYVYVFCLIEMKMRFSKVRLWYGAYFVLVVTQNFTLTAIWYWQGTWENFWYSYMAIVIVGSSALSHTCFVIYLLILKPKVKVVYPVNSSLSLFDATI